LGPHHTARDQPQAAYSSAAGLLKAKVEDLNVHAARARPATRERPIELTIEGYVVDRVNDQINNYYTPNGRKNAVYVKRFHDLEFALGLLAVILGAIASTAAATGLSWLSGLGPWVAVVTSASAAVTAHLAASHFDHAALIYFATANRLVSLRDEWLANPDRLLPAHTAKLVDDCENAISTENEAWLAEWTNPRGQVIEA
jgi:hypothetical protein